LAQSGSRKGDRKHVLLSATVISADGPHEVRMRDLSPTGVQIACDGALVEHSDVIFRRGAIFVAARVAWTDTGKAGLEFYRQLDGVDLG
jgi:PilZ domain